MVVLVHHGNDDDSPALLAAQTASFLIFGAMFSPVSDVIFRTTSAIALSRAPGSCPGRSSTLAHCHSMGMIEQAGQASPQ